MSDLTPLATATQMITHYNAQDADAYVSLMTDSACEASYRGAVVRDGKEGTRSFVPTPSVLRFFCLRISFVWCQTIDAGVWTADHSPA